MNKIILLCIITLSLYSDDILYLNIPKELPSNNTNSTFGNKLKKLIKEARFSIDFAIYGLYNQNDILQALIEAQKRGVVIKGIVDSDAHNQNYYKDTTLLYKYFTIKSDHQNYIMHNKFFIFDKKILWTGSANLSSTGTGGYNANNVIVINNKKISLIYLEEFNQMFNVNKFHKHKNKIYSKTIKTKNSTVSIYFSPKSNTYQKGIKKLINSAKKYIYIPIFYLTSKSLAKDLINAKKRNIDIKIILDATAAHNKFSIHKYLREKGIQVKIENFGGKMHCKSMIIDDKYFITGSMNFTKTANNFNDENSLIIKNKILPVLIERNCTGKGGIFYKWQSRLLLSEILRRNRD